MTRCWHCNRLSRTAETCEHCKTCQGCGASAPCRVAMLDLSQAEGRRQPMKKKLKDIKRIVAQINFPLRGLRVGIKGDGFSSRSSTTRPVSKRARSRNSAVASGT